MWGCAADETCMTMFRAQARRYTPCPFYYENTDS